MNSLFSLCCLMLFSTLAIKSRAQPEGRSISGFVEMCLDYIGLKAFRYVKYGCYCGIGRSSGPVMDDVDRCCYDHDKCYEQLNAKGCNPKSEEYTFRIVKKKIICSAKNGSCAMETCLCDKTASECFKLKDKFQDDPGCEF